MNSELLALIREACPLEAPASLDAATISHRGHGWPRSPASHANRGSPAKQHSSTGSAVRHAIAIKRPLVSILWDVYMPINSFQDTLLSSCAGWDGHQRLTLPPACPAIQAANPAQHNGHGPGVPLQQATRQKALLVLQQRNKQQLERLRALQERQRAQQLAALSGEVAAATASAAPQTQSDAAVSAQAAEEPNPVSAAAQLDLHRFGQHAAASLPGAAEAGAQLLQPHAGAGAAAVRTANTLAATAPAAGTADEMQQGLQQADARLAARPHLAAPYGLHPVPPSGSAQGARLPSFTTKNRPAQVAPSAPASRPAAGGSAAALLAARRAAARPAPPSSKPKPAAAAAPAAKKASMPAAAHGAPVAAASQRPQPATSEALAPNVGSQPRAAAIEAADPQKAAQLQVGWDGMQRAVLAWYIMRPCSRSINCQARHSFLPLPSRCSITQSLRHTAGIHGAEARAGSGAAAAGAARKGRVTQAAAASGGAVRSAAARGGWCGLGEGGRGRERADALSGPASGLHAG